MDNVFQVSHFYQWEKLPDVYLPSGMAEFADNGATHLTFTIGWCERILGDAAFAVTLARQLAAHGLAVREAHALCGAQWDLNVEDTARRPQMIAGHQVCMAMLADMGVRTYTMHIGAAPCFTNGGRYTDDLRALSLQTLEALLPTAERLNMIIAVENAFEPANTPEEVLACIRPFNSPHIACCFDVGHATMMSATQKRPVSAINAYLREQGWGGNIVLHPHALETLAPWIVTCHFHDNDATADAHALPGTGTTDWPAVMAGLRKCPRLAGIQNETSLVDHGVSIAKACRTFDALVRM